MSVLEVILLEDVEHLGKAGQVVRAKAGYVRNYLLPRNLVRLLTRSSLNWLKANLETLRQQSEEKVKQTKILAKKVEALGLIKIQAKTSSQTNGKLFGRVTPKNISDKIKELCSVEVSKLKIQVNESIYRNSIDQVGLYNLTIKFSPQVSCKLQLQVESESKS